MENNLPLSDRTFATEGRLTDDALRQAVRNQNCSRELMFGKAPLSIIQKVNGNGSDVELSPKSTESSTSLKRKPTAVNNKSESEQSSPKSLENDSPLAKKVRISPRPGKEKCFQSLISQKPNRELKWIDRKTDGEVNQQYGDKQIFNSCSTTSTTNSTSLGPANLQADWSLPCFKAADGANVLSLPSHGTTSSRNSSPKSPMTQSMPTAPKYHELCAVAQEMQSLSHFTGPSTSSWDQGLKTNSQMSGDNENIQNQSELYSANITTQQLLHSLRLEGCQGEIMIVPHSDTSHNGQFIFMPQANGNGNLRYLQPSSAQSPNHDFNQSRPQGNSTTESIPQQREKFLQLNSSGEEKENIPEESEELSPQRPPYPSTLQKQVERAHQAMRIDSPVFGGCDENDPSRQQHNHKERIRRARIRDACHLLRQLVPGMSDKTDKATVFEFAARYVHFLRAFVGDQYDKDFLIKYSPY